MHVASDLEPQASDRVTHDRAGQSIGSVGGGQDRPGDRRDDTDPPGTGHRDHWQNACGEDVCRGVAASPSVGEMDATLIPHAPVCPPADHGHRGGERLGGSAISGPDGVPDIPMGQGKVKGQGQESSPTAIAPHASDGGRGDGSGGLGAHGGGAGDDPPELPQHRGDREPGDHAAVRYGTADRSHDSHREHAGSAPPACPASGAGGAASCATVGAEASARAFLSAGDRDAEEDGDHTDVSGHDRQLVERLVQQYSREFASLHKHGTARQGTASSFLFEVYCGPNSQLVKQCHAANVHALRFGLEQCDLSTVEGRRYLFQKMCEHRPKHIWFAPECRLWSSWSALNGQKSLGAFDQQQKNRVTMLAQVALGITLLRVQNWCGAHLHWEQPRTSLMLRLACLREVRAQTVETHVDLCQLGMIDPESGIAMRKSLVVLTTSTALGRVLDSFRCRGEHDHQVIAGSTHVEGKSVLRSKVSENYPRKFARVIVQTLKSFKGTTSSPIGAQVLQAEAYVVRKAESPVNSESKRPRIMLQGSSQFRRRADVNPTTVHEPDDRKRRRLHGKQTARARQMHDHSCKQFMVRLPE